MWDSSYGAVIMEGTFIVSFVLREPTANREELLFIDLALYDFFAKMYLKLRRAYCNSINLRCILSLLLFSCGDIDSNMKTYNQVLTNWPQHDSI